MIKSGRGARAPSETAGQNPPTNKQTVITPTTTTFHWVGARARAKNAICSSVWQRKTAKLKTAFADVVVGSKQSQRFDSPSSWHAVAVFCVCGWVEAVTKNYLLIKSVRGDDVFFFFSQICAMMRSRFPISWRRFLAVVLAKFSLRRAKS